MEGFLPAFLLTLLAGLSTGIGSLLALLSRKSHERFFSVALGFSAGVMIYVSLVEIYNQAQGTLIAQYGAKPGMWITLAAFFGGVALIAIIDKLIPETGHPHHEPQVSLLPVQEPVVPQGVDGFALPHSTHDVKKAKKQKNMMRVGLITALSIAIHNFPEGMATFTAAMQDPKLGLAIAIAIAIHNIPEGVAVAVPILMATGSRKKATLWSFLSGLAEPLGALVGYLLLRTFFTDAVMGVLFAAVAGIMVFISFDKLLPTAIDTDQPHLAIYGAIGGMAVMGVSLALLA